jgi:hypothetical protein
MPKTRKKQATKPVRNGKGVKSLKQKQKPAATPPTPPAAPAPKKETSSTIPLNTAIDVRREQAKLYREARSGTLEASKAGKLVWMLGEVRRTIETEDIEAGLAELRAAAVKQGLLK